MSKKVTVFDLITSKDAFLSTKAIVASNLAVTAAMIAATAKTPITDDTVRRAKRVFDSCLALLPTYRD